MRRKRILSQKRPAAGGEARERASFLKIVCCHDFSCQNFFVVFQVAQKELRCIFLSQKRPAAGGEARERASFLKIVCCHDFSCQNFFVVFQVAQKELRCI